MSHHVCQQSLQAWMTTGQSLWDTFMFRPSPPAAPRSLKVTFVAFVVSDAQRYKVMLLVEAPYPGSGLVHLDKDVHTSCGCFLHSHTFPGINWILCAWLKKCLLKSNKNSAVCVFRKQYNYNNSKILQASWCNMQLHSSCTSEQMHWSLLPDSNKVWKHWDS